MLPFELGIKISLILTAIFYLIFSYLCFGWAKVHYPGKTERNINLKIAFTISLLYGFLFFLGSLIVLFLISLLLKYFPLFINFFKK